MPLARANTSGRSKSRSPLPQSPRPPTFLPPSHYAEAGGLSPRPLARNDSITSSSDSHSHHHGKLESRRSSAFMPISSNSDSSFEFCPKPKPVENKRFSISSGSKSGSRNAAKRESHMTNLPFVEAQLLPSLRDTIDRMTRPPSRAFAPPSSPEHDVDSNERSSEYIPEAQVLDDPSYFCSQPAPPTPKPLKSALRAPTPKLQLRSPRSPALAAPPPNTRCYSDDQAPGRSFTGATTTSSRLLSGSALVSSTLKNNEADNLASPTPIRTRPRSRTDPGAPPDLHTPSIATPILKSDIRSGGVKGSAVSNIPRPRANSGLRSASSTPRPRPSEPAAADDSSSDLELRYELAGRSRRSLRVVNGVLSSESESEGETRAAVGLGLGLAAPYTSQSFASKLRARFSRNNPDAQYAVDEAAERRRKELLGLVKGLDKLGSQLQGYRQPEDDSGESSDHACGVAISGSGGLDLATPTSHAEPPRFLVSSSSGRDGELQRDPEDSRPERERRDRRSRSLSPAPPRPPKDRYVEDKKERKNPSRSPIIRQSAQLTLQADEGADVIPSALRRHSVYYSAPPRPISPVSSPRKPERPYSADLQSQSPESLYEEPDDEGQEPHVRESPTSYRHAHDRLQPRFQRHSDDLANSDTVMLALHSRLAAAREREALGIPPSASDAGYAGAYPRQGEGLSYMDSGSSLARVGMEDGDARGRGPGNLSFGAEKLFRTLSGRTADVGSWKMSDPLQSISRRVPAHRLCTTTTTTAHAVLSPSGNRGKVRSLARRKKRVTTRRKIGI
ncbi:hypothetical protein B0H12DRAFT_343368 [Mycena haematopus]|nr:hypothetical protein B0H12DRAFT_343368 [Mycena haematopus]